MGVWVLPESREHHRAAPCMQKTQRCKTRQRKEKRRRGGGEEEEEKTASNSNNTHA